MKKTSLVNTGDISPEIAYNNDNDNMIMMIMAMSTPKRGRAYRYFVQ